MLDNHNKTLSTTALTLLIVGAIDSIRNLPATALFGSSLIFFFVLSALFFLLPAALVSAQLSSKNSTRSGIYYWVHSAFGEKVAFFSIWLQWINTMVWFPTILSFIAGTAAYFISPELAQNKLYLVSVILVTFWTITIISLQGVQTSAKFANACTVIGMILPMIFIISLALAWIGLGKPLQLQFTLATMLPSLNHTDNWISLTAIMTSFLGMELATVHIREVGEPQKKFPRALFFAVILILVTMIMGSLAIALVLPKEQISLVNGVMQAFSNFLGIYHLKVLIPVITVMLLLGSLGGMVSWIISPARGLLQAAENGYLPSFMTYKNQHGVASNLLLMQAILVTFICLAFLLMPSVNGSYWLLTDLSTQLYIMMYVMMFVAALCLQYKAEFSGAGFSIPGGRMGTWLVCLAGIAGCLVTLAVGFIPPDGFNVGGALHYEITFVMGLFVMILPVLFFYAFKAKSFSKKNSSAVAAHDLI
jgi:amino acid transporter